MPVLVFVPPSFCLTTYKNVILGGEYVSLGKIKASYSNSLALDDLNILNDIVSRLLASLNMQLTYMLLLIKVGVDVDS